MSIREYQRIFKNLRLDTMELLLQVLDIRSRMRRSPDQRRNVAALSKFVNKLADLIQLILEYETLERTVSPVKYYSLETRYHKYQDKIGKIIDDYLWT